MVYADIMVVDDNHRNRTLLSEILKDKYSNVSLYNSGGNAIQSLDLKIPDLILLDIMMPDISGYEVCKILKSDPKTKHIPVIFITGRTDVESIKEGFDYGGADYITKPFQKEELLARVKTHLTIKLDHDELLVRRDEIMHLNMQLQGQLESAHSTIDKNRDELKDAAYKGEIAEVTTDLLHNVKNMINSIYVSTNLLSNNLDVDNNVKKLRKCIELIREHENDFTAFFMSEKGGTLINYLELLVGEFERSNTFNVALLERVLKYSGLMDSLIAAQQKYGAESQLEQIEISETVSDVLTIMDNQIQALHVQVQVDYSDKVFVEGIKVRLFHIVLNLIKNSIEAMVECESSERKIIVTNTIDDGIVNMKFQDTGCGIPSDVIGNMFSRGFSTKEFGHGFGLHSCREYLNDMGGTISVESPGEGEGTVFTITLPSADRAG